MNHKFLKVFMFKISFSLFSRSRCRKQHLQYNDVNDSELFHVLFHINSVLWTLNSSLNSSILTCLIRSSLRTAIISPHNIHQLVFLMDAHSVLCGAKLNLYTDKINMEVVPKTSNQTISIPKAFFATAINNEMRK